MRALAATGPGLGDAPGCAYHRGLFDGRADLLCESRSSASDLPQDLIQHKVPSLRLVLTASPSRKRFARCCTRLLNLLPPAWTSRVWSWPLRRPPHAGSNCKHDRTPWFSQPLARRHRLSLGHHLLSHVLLLLLDLLRGPRCSLGGRTASRRLVEHRPRPPRPRSRHCQRPAPRPRPRRAASRALRSR